MYQLSVLVPGIRTSNWRTLYNSIGNSFSGKWEIIFISPYKLPNDVRGKNIKHITDWGTPIRCQQRGLVESEGEYITWAADDGKFQLGALDISFKKLEGADKNTLVMGKYIEGIGNQHMLEDSYYILNNHSASNLEYVPPRCWMLNVGVVPKELLIKLGGWDCQFEVCPMAYNDLAIRLQYYGAKFIIQDEVMFKCGYTPGHMGDHGPIHDAQTMCDQPLFSKIWSDPDSKKRMIIDINNWEQSPKRWKRRFGDEN